MVTIDTARELLEHRVLSRLAPALENERGGTVSWASLAKLSHEAVSAVVDTKDGLEMLFLAYLAEHPEFLSRLERKEGVEWLRTDQVAKLVGFSAPYVRAVLDSEPFFQGKVRRSEGGQRSVTREVVEQWMKTKSLLLPAEREWLPDYERETPDLGASETIAADVMVQV